MGRTTAVYSHLHVFGVRPHVGPTAFLHCISDAVALFVILMMCSLKLSLLSSVTPKNLTVGDNSIGVFPTFIGRSVHFLFQVNMTILVLRVLTESPLVEHQFSIVVIVLCVRSQITSRSLPSARDDRSSANAWRYPGISFAE